MCALQRKLQPVVIVLILGGCAQAQHGESGKPAGSTHPRPEPVQEDSDSMNSDHRIISGSADLQVSRVFGSLGDQAHQFQGPFGIRLGPDENLYIADDLAHRISVFDSNGRPMRTLGKRGTREGEVAWVDAVAFDSKGLLYVADTGNGRVQVWTQEGKFLRQFGTSQDASEPTLKNPRDIVIDRRGMIYVADFQQDAVMVFDAEGRWVQSIGAASGPGKLDGPVQLCLDDEELYVSDMHHNRIAVFDSDGELVRTIDGSGQLKAPHGVAIGPDGYLYVANYGADQVEVFSRDGRHVRSLGRSGTRPGELKNPTDLDFDSEGAMYIVDKRNHRVQVWKRLSHSGSGSDAQEDNGP